MAVEMLEWREGSKMLHALRDKIKKHRRAESVEVWEVGRKISSWCKAQLNSKMSCQMAARRSPLAFQREAGHSRECCRSLNPCVTVPMGTTMGDCTLGPCTFTIATVSLYRMHSISCLGWSPSTTWQCGWIAEAVKEKGKQCELLEWEMQAHTDFLRGALCLPACLVIFKWWLYNWRRA